MKSIWTLLCSIGALLVFGLVALAVLIDVVVRGRKAGGFDDASES